MTLRKKDIGQWVGLSLTMVIIGAGAFSSSPAKGAEDPDALYREGRFAEAEKIYAQSDMDHPKDSRYRYNRGCADYQTGDYQGAMAAFTSVLRRAEDREIRFRAAYNLGNAAFKQGDAASAAEYYRQAIRIDPEQADARHNLELALRKLEAQKKEQEKKETSPGQKGKQEDPSKKEGNQGKGEEKPPPDKSSPKDSDPKNPPDREDAQDKPDETKQQDEGKKDGQGPKQEGNDQNAPKDLSGELKPREALPGASEGSKGGPSAVSTMDKKKAEALLDNVTEDRSKFLRLQMQEEKRRGAVSGKDW